jgi:two-component system response regulator FixJ
MEHPNLYVVDDDTVLARRIKRLFEQHGYRVTCYGTPNAFLDTLPSLELGCILTDLLMPQFTGLELLRTIRERGVRWPVVLISGRGDISAAVETMRLGAADFVEKPFRNEDLLSSVEGAFDTYGVTQEASRADIRAQELLKSLSPRQMELMQGIAQGHSNKAIARNLEISPRTVEVHRARLMERLQAKSLADVVRLAVWAQANMPSAFEGANLDFSNACDFIPALDEADSQVFPRRRRFDSMG